MKIDDIISMGKETAHELGIEMSDTVFIDMLVQAAYFRGMTDERERCAEICDSVAANAVLGTANECARAIRGQ